MEYGNVPLSKILEAKKIYTSEELAFVMQSLVESFKILQDNGISHGDIKPHNIILVKNHDSYDYKPSDFGEAYIFPEDSKKRVLSINELRGFTKYFAAPEILEIEKLSHMILSKQMFSH